jgi:mono/diheme cytochrome c family protein
MSAQGRAVIGFIVGAGVFACSPQKAPEAPAAQASAQTAEKGAITEQARTQAREIFAGRCTPCHGPTGAGDGAASAGLTPKPRNFQDAAWQKSVTDEHIEKIVAYGGAAVGKAPMMPANPDLADNAAVLAALREHVRGLAK